MVDIDPAAQATENQPVPPQEGELTIEFADDADNAQGGPSVEGQGEGADTTPPPPEMILGKFNSQADLENAYQEVERKLHETSEQKSVYERALESIQGNQTTQTQQPAPDMDAANDQFRTFAEQNPIGAIEFVAEQIVNRREQARTQAQSGMMTRFNTFSEDQLYRDVAPIVMQKMALDPSIDVEKEFMAAKIAQMTTNAQTQGVMQAAQTQRMHVETGSSRQADNTLRIEVDPDAHKLRGAFNDLGDSEEWKNLNIRTAKIQELKSSPKAPVSIDQWTAVNKGVI